jgi:hypothetical protein
MLSVLVLQVDTPSVVMPNVVAPKASDSKESNFTKEIVAGGLFQLPVGQMVFDQNMWHHSHKMFSSSLTVRLNKLDRLSLTGLFGLVQYLRVWQEFTLVTISHFLWVGSLPPNKIRLGYKMPKTNTVACLILVSLTKKVLKYFNTVTEY